jgi:hypothetical protein
VWNDESMAKGETIRWSGGCNEGKLSGNGVLEVFEGDKRTLRYWARSKAPEAKARVNEYRTLVVVTHEFPMSEAEEALKISASQQCGKILLYPHRH